VKERFRGCLLGLAVGDAVGTTVEFSPPGTFAPVTDLVGGGPFGLPIGAWTDDTSMALCLAESLLESDGFDPIDQLERYVRWWKDGYLSSTGECFDIGRATRLALQRFRKTGEPYPGDADENAAGNGPLMKLAPIPMAYARRPSDAEKYAVLSSRTTHGAPQAHDAARFFASVLVEALNGRRNVLRRRKKLRVHPEVKAVAAGSYLDKAPPEIRGNGYVVLALEAALWAVASTNTYEAAILAAVNLGDDADTTAAIAGQLAGALYGVDGIPKRWRNKLVLHDEIGAYADRLYEFAHGL
jgi:ADP-ribosyl-[dinitrogen reductase] hydrolase